MGLREEVLKYKISESQLKDYSNNAIEKYKQEKTKVEGNFSFSIYSFFYVSSMCYFSIICFIIF